LTDQVVTLADYDGRSVMRPSLVVKIAQAQVRIVSGRALVGGEIIKPERQREELSV